MRSFNSGESQNRKKTQQHAIIDIFDATTYQVANFLVCPFPQIPNGLCVYIYMYQLLSNLVGKSFHHVVRSVIWLGQADFHVEGCSDIVRSVIWLGQADFHVEGCIGTFCSCEHSLVVGLELLVGKIWYNQRKLGSNLPSYGQIEL